jgi:phenylacetic acid degradation protein
MPCYAFQGIVPVVDPTSYVHPLACLIGDVIVGPGCYIAPGASLRGDFGRIVVEGDTSVQDHCTLHTSSGNDLRIGRGATLAHGAVLHGCVIGEHSLVGINAVVLDNARIGTENLVAALSLVKADTVTPPRALVAGNPARVVRELSARQITWRNDGRGEYQRLARESLIDLVECAARTEAEADRPRIRANAVAVRLGARPSEEPQPEPSGIGSP